MEGGHARIVAIGACAHGIADDAVVADAPDLDEVHTLAHVVILAPGLQPLAHRVGAGVVAAGVFQHRLEGKDFHRPEHHREVGGAGELVAIQDVHLLAGVGSHVPTDSLGDEHRVRVSLDGPLVVAPLVKLDDLVPHVHEEPRVTGRAVHRRLDNSGLHLHGLDLVAPRVLAEGHDAVRGEDVVLVTCEDAKGVVHLALHDGHLVAAGASEGEAVERRGAFDGEADSLRAKLLARPSLVVVRRILALHTVRLASRPPRILLIADGVHAMATLRLRAVLVLVGALLDGPLGEHASLRRWGRSPGADLLAVPTSLPWVRLLAGRTMVFALCPVGRFDRAALRVTLVVTIEAALGRGTILARLGALLPDPALRAGREWAQLLARPRVRVNVHQVRGAREALGLTRCPILVLFEALRPSLLAALRLQAVLSGAGTLDLARGPLAELLAAPRLLVPMRRDGPGIARLAALRVELVLLVAQAARVVATPRDIAIALAPSAL
mmetsp:Transcript_121515/g.349247  ORF Transcript_121515/g.349247 Transcript_121515/m.349247 type:complete len:495 (+) Transcript_121515:245-1729(+)